MVNTDIFVQLIMLCCIFSFFGFIFISIFLSYKRNSKSISLNDGYKELELKSSDKNWTNYNMQNIDSIPSGQVNVHRYSTTRSTELEIKIEELTFCYNISNIDTFGLRFWKLGTLVGRVDDDYFHIIKYRLGYKCFLNKVYIGYIPDSYRFYSWGYTKIIRKIILDKNGTKFAMVDNSKDTKTIEVSSELDLNLNENSQLNTDSNRKFSTSMFEISIVDMVGKELARMSYGGQISRKGMKISMSFTNKELELDKKWLLFCNYIINQNFF